MCLMLCPCEGNLVEKLLLYLSICDTLSLSLRVNSRAERVLGEKNHGDVKNKENSGGNREN
jgi:hypothetical protein